MLMNLKQWRIGAARGIAVPAVVASAALLATGSAEARPVSRPPAARAARTLKASDTAHLRYVSAAGSLLSEEGSATGTLPGKMRASVNIGASISGNFTISTKGGTINGHGSATPHGSGTFESFAGSIVVTGGTGRFAHARGKTGLYGTFNRSTYALTIQTTGTLSY
jgi:hypothetical protein